MRIRLTDLSRFGCAWHKALRAGKVHNGTVEISAEKYAEIRAACAMGIDDIIDAKTSPPAGLVLTPPTSPEKQWPLAIKWLAKRRRPGDVGAGDTLERLLTRIGADRAAKVWERLAGKPCGCQDRKGRLNSRYPYVQSLR